MIRWRNLDGGYEDRFAALRALTPFELLGIQPGCTAAETRRAYLALVKTYHPDHADDFMATYGQEVLKLINQAYADITKRPG